MEHKKNFLLAFLWTIGITIACLVSISDVPNVSIFGKDKTVHGFFYLIFSVLWFLFLTKEMPQWSFVKKATFVVLASLFYGAMIEICQGQFTATRKADFYDVIANVSGSIIGVLLLRSIEKYRIKKAFKK